MKTDVVVPIHLINRAGAADALIICDHASRSIPHSYGDLGFGRALNYVASAA